MTKYKCYIHGAIATPHTTENCRTGETQRCPLCFAKLDEI